MPVVLGPRPVAFGTTIFDFDEVGLQGFFFCNIGVQIERAVDQVVGINQVPAVIAWPLVGSLFDRRADDERGLGVLALGVFPTQDIEVVIGVSQLIFADVIDGRHHQCVVSQRA
ncbi:MAG: hypothetical protein JWN70_5014 [Planctomycetaceae bacterium]|nr:hypothetical protein [Planctomycetaceae bacterium]